MKAILSVFLLLIFGGMAHAEGVEGYWRGTATRGGESTPISLEVERGPKGLRASYNIPALSVEGMPLTDFSYDPSTGAIATARGFKGRLHGGRITGELSPALIHGPPAQIALRLVGDPPPLNTNERAVEFMSRGNALKGRLISPLKRGRYPAIVSLHGSGPSTRWLALARARRFAQAGYAMLIYDKPGSGESEGDWTATSLDEMAQDANAAVEFLRRQPEVDDSKIGLWGHSQAGWVISRAAAMPNNIAFAIVLAGGGSTSREVENYGYLGRLKHANASPEASAKAMTWVSEYFDYVRTGNGYDALTARLNNAAGEEWAKALGIDTVYPTPVQQPKWQWVATYDPRSDIQRIAFPVLLVFADQDQNTPSQESLKRWREALAEGGNRKVEWKTFVNADHHFLTPPHTDGWPKMSPGYYEAQVDWLRRILTP